MDPETLQDQLAALDIAQPWFLPYSSGMEEARGLVGQGAQVHDALSGVAGDACGPAMPRFVPAGELPPGEAYEAFVARTGSVPTRDNLHDFFNALVWLRMPRAKRRINELQAAEIAARGVGGVRGTVRDALTLFDESGALLDAPPALWAALLARDWNRLFVELRPLWREARVLVFGHAVLEKLAQPRKDVTAHVWYEPCDMGRMEELDTWLARQLTAERLRAKPFTPLPLLGVPGWSPENQNFSFYDDSRVFRPPGRRGT